MDLNKGNHEAGFTLLEMMMVIAVIGILALFALPKYQAYLYEAKATEILVDIHQIALAYHDIFATGNNLGQDNHQLSSPQLGSPPPVFSNLNDIYQERHGLQLSSQMANHAGYFSQTGTENFIVLFVQATNDEGLHTLNALDHVTKFRHTFVSPNLMMMALAQPYQSLGNHPPNHQANTPGASVPVSSKPVASTSPQAKTPPPIQQAPVQPSTQPQVQAPVPVVSSSSTSGQGTLNPASQSSDHQPQQHAQSLPQPEQHNQAPEQHNTDTHQTPSSAIPAYQAGLNWPPGWAKHPGQHMNQNHPGHGHGHH